MSAGYVSRKWCVVARQRSTAWQGLLIGLLGLVGLALAPATGLGGEEVMMDGVLHVKNSATPSKGTEVLELEELWRVGGEGDETFFGLISQVIADDAGNLYLLDTQLSEVQVYSPEGENIKTLSREGEGPGEVRRPTGLLFMPDGNLGLVQVFPGKIIQVDTDGNPAGVLTIGSGDPTQGGFSVLLDADCRGGHLVLVGILISQEQAAQERTNFLASFSLEGVEQARYLEKKVRFDFTDVEIIEKDQYFVFPRRWALSPQGRVCAAPFRNRYAIHVYANDGTLERVIERAFTPRKRTEKELSRFQGLLDAQSSRFGGEVKSEIEDTEPDITTIRVADDGTIWVAHSRSGYEQPEGIMETYDVFDEHGHLIKQVAVACPGDGLEDGLFFIGADRAVLVTGILDAVFAMQGGSAAAEEEDEEPTPMEAIYYRIAR